MKKPIPASPSLLRAAIASLVVAALPAQADFLASLSPAAPSEAVEISQAAATHNLQLAWRVDPGSDRNPRDAGQSFLVGGGGLVLDKITVKLETLASAGYDGGSLTVDIFTLSDGSDFEPDSSVASESGSLPADMKSAFDGGSTYLTFDITDLPLAAGQYGFLLMHDAQGAPADNMKIAAVANADDPGAADYADGIGIVREQRGTGADSFMAAAVWTGQSTPADLEYYLQGSTGEDTTPPALDSTDPADDATGVPTGAELVADFSEVVQAGTGNISLRRADNNSEVEAFDVETSTQLTFGGSVTITPSSPLDTGNEYYILIPATAIKDASDNFFLGITDPAGWSFTADNAPPNKTDMGPAAGTDDVSPNADLTLAFDEEVLGVAGKTITVHLAGDGSVVETIDGGSLASTGGAISIDIASLAPDTAYYVLVEDGAFVDLSGFSYSGISDPAAWSFRTATVAITMSPGPPSEGVVVSQTAADTGAPFRWEQPSGNDQNPRDAGQSFLSSGFVLDKITVNLSTLATNAYDSGSMTVEIFKLSDGADFEPDSVVASESLVFPADMKASFDAGDTYLTIDITDVPLDAGQQYGFLLMHDAQQSSGDNMLLAGQIGSGFTDGIGIRRHNRGSAGDVYEELTLWDGDSSEPSDLEFYLQSSAFAPFAITDIVYASGTDKATLTWRSRPGVFYMAFASPDLADWSLELADSLGSADDEIADDGNHITVTFTLTDGLEELGDLFFRVAEE